MGVRLRVERQATSAAAPPTKDRAEGSVTFCQPPQILVSMENGVFCLVIVVVQQAGALFVCVCDEAAMVILELAHAMRRAKLGGMIQTVIMF